MIVLDDLVRDWLDRGIAPSMEALGDELKRNPVDAGWRTDEELVIMDDGRMDGTVFGAPALEAMDLPQREGAVTAIERLLISRGELVEGEGDTGEVVGPVALVVSVLRSSDRQATVESRRAEAARFLVCRRRDDICLIEEVFVTGMHHFTFVDLSGEADLVAAMISPDPDWTIPTSTSVSGPAESPDVAAAIATAEAGATAAALVTSLTRDAVLAGATKGPDAVATYYSGPRGVVSVDGTDAEVAVRGLTHEEFLDHLSGVLR